MKDSFKNKKNPQTKENLHLNIPWVFFDIQKECNIFLCTFLLDC